VKHLRGLDGIRGIAVALVVAHHIVVRDPDAAMKGGWMGVDLFFVLSGYLITTSVLRRSDVGEFLRRRFWRLFPAGAVLLAVYVVASLAADDRRQRLEWAFAASTQWLNVQGAIGPPFSPHIGHLWSLSAEVQFYVAWGLGLAFLLRRRAPRAAIVGLLVVLFVLTWIERIVLLDGGAIWNRLYLGPDTHSASLLAGCVVGLAAGWGWLRARRTLAVLALPAAALIAWEVIELSFLDDRTYRWGLSGLAIAGAVVVAGAALRVASPLRPLLELAPLAVLGRASYSVYLWHLPIIEEVARRNEGDIGRIAMVSLPITAVVATASYLAIERPFMRGVPGVRRAA
jgi:peptidoglycan/LPS O-acetylase OafA/YrhL